MQNDVLAMCGSFGHRTHPPVDRAYVRTCLEEAGRTLLALPGSGYSPRLQQPGLDVVRNFMEAYGWHEVTVRPAFPSPRAIDEMDERFRWLRHIPRDRYVLRRIIGARMLVNPVTDRHLYTWRRIAKTIGADYHTIQRWHHDGLDLIVAGLLREINFANHFSNSSKSAT